ncbi:hypothetical protein [Erythrobacter aureus]|nr:hypothetical protein [Erythrobacter aureus]
METVATDYAPSIRDEYCSVPSLELSLAGGEETTIGVFDMEAKMWLVGDIPLDERPIFSGFTRNQLSEAFEKVRDPNNWKHPIDKVMPADLDQNLTSAAVAFFAGSETAFEQVPEGVRVTAAGYYADIGA